MIEAAVLLFLLGLIVLRTRFSWLSPVCVFYVYFLLVIVFTIPYHYLIPRVDKFAIARLDFIPDKKMWETIYVFIRMLCCFSVGVLLHKLTFNLRRNTFKKVELDFKLPAFNEKQLLLIASMFFVFCTIMNFVIYGTGIFFRRSYQLETESKLGIILLEFSTLGWVFLSALLYDKYRYLSMVYVFLAVTFCLSWGSRMASLFLVVYLGIVYLLFLKNKLTKLGVVLFFIPFMIFFFGMNIELRFADNHGLLPYAEYVFNYPEKVVESSFFNIYYSFVFGVYATARTILLNEYNYANLITSINPSPGFLTDWYLIYKKLRITPYAPFSAIGELYTYPIFANVFYIVLGIYYSLVEKNIQVLFQKKKFIIAIFLFLVSIAFIPYSFEYNLRSSVRFLYYSMFFLIGIKILTKYKIVLKK